ncbi:heavy-metal-associated domain-containing protein [Tuwongella immobilis]|uniref:HMA domain-containing protein n=1 Tax=Tuwongella immobilis TaxID=692036 RepID=A0A6C2YLK5_9BACT|nr:heavy metal-associated domain-containing protein [Tuwongella immobilis]VIP02247.1 copper chaperone : Copper chaperone OS=Gordonia alkanivorans CGMCC 6845 GN=V525_02830 PE=4 SV=1: HMA [Tuwongella immobilis]VTS00828.1 copper chaperone : Copper chaperone OS=Gordonia alkanivorans CGMCC 6845 GN=V525_02830 PE=4 SV=1: HMA [Tuwongella immobilis]
MTVSHELPTSTTEITVGGIVCQGCAAAVKSAINRLPDIRSVDVEVPTHRVRVVHGRSISREEIAGALLKAGFPPA